MFVNWDNALALRGLVLKSVEQLRREGQIGSGSEACLTIKIRGSPHEHGLIDSRFVKMLCKIGDVFFEPGPVSGPFSAEVVAIRSLKNDPEYVLCPRCLQYSGVYTRPANFDNLCDRCCAVLVQGFPDHEAVAGIKSRLAEHNAAKKGD